MQHASGRYVQSRHASSFRRFMIYDAENDACKIRNCSFGLISSHVTSDPFHVCIE